MAEERARIARELHDIVAHAVSVMVLHVGAVRHRLPDALAEDREALGASSRPAVRRWRRCAGCWPPCAREGDEVELAPQPGLDGLEPLLDDMSTAGLPVRLHVEGEPVALPPAIDLSAYRIVQEGLTNALKHAGASKAEVTLRYRPEDAADRGARRRCRVAGPRRRRVTGWSVCASASRSTVAR